MRRALAALMLTSLAAVSTAGLTGAPAQAAKVSRSTMTVTAMADSYEASVIAKINEKRKAKGLKPVKQSGACIDGKAETWSRHLASTGQFYHQDLAPVLKDCKAASVGEILVKGAGLTPQAAVDAWMASDGHRKVMLGTKYTLAGVGAWKNSAGDVYIATVFRD